MRECIWHQVYFKDFKSKIKFYSLKVFLMLMRLKVEHGEVWTSISTIKGKDSIFMHVSYTIEVNRSDMGRTELLVIKEY